MIEISTIGFTKKSAESFFRLIGEARVKTLIDVRLNNVSQLAGFAKRDDLAYFLRTICGAEYAHMPELAPTKALLHAYKTGEINWEKYEDRFLNLMAQRHIERLMSQQVLHQSCLLCSEHEPHFCHRRLVVEYLNRTLDITLSVRHLQK